MPNIRQLWTPYLGPFSNVEQFHQNLLGTAQMGTAALFHPGEAGSRVILSEVGPGVKEYQLCQIDSGCTASTPTGALALGQLLYWKNRPLYQVTNDQRFSDLGSGTARNNVQAAAGILVTNNGSGVLSALPGDWVYLQTKGKCTVVLTPSSPAVGDFAVPNNSATVPQVSSVAIGTAPSDTLVGRFTTTATASVATVDLQLPEIP